MDELTRTDLDGVIILTSLHAIRRSRGVRQNRNLKKYITGYYPAYRDLFKTCPICLKEYTRGRIVYKVNCCGKEYHRCCLERWLKNSAKCPMCRGAIRD